MKILIVGGVAGGATAATRLRRLSEENEVIIFEKGQYVSFANCGLPYHISGTIDKRDALLLQTPESLKERYNLDVRVFTEVLSIYTDEKKISVKNLQTGEIYLEDYDKLLLSPGAEPIKPPFEGIDSDKIYTLRNIPDMDKIVAKTKNAQNFVVVGGGFIGLEVAENLIEAGKSVKLVELGNQVMAPVDFDIASFVHEKAKQKNLELLLNVGVDKFNDKGETIEVFLNDGTSLETDAVILAIGVKPETKLAVEAGLEIGETRGILVNEFMQTSNPDIYAVGDAIEVAHYINNKKVLIPLAWPANRQGRIVADNIVLGNQYKYTGSLGSSILKFFELSVASTGLNEKTLKRFGIPYKTAIVTRGHHAGYYPGAKNMVLKLIFDENGKIFGAQAVGEDGVDKRIDVIATAIKGNLTVYDLPEIEITYAPPFNSAKDPVNIAGYAAENILKGDLEMVNYDEFWDFVKENDAVILDVRTSKEFSGGAIEGAININVDDLRANLENLDRNKVYAIYCQVGLRGYLANRIMRNNGFRAVNLNGGYNLWSKVQS
ncbi:FAD-dependent oxidoreductase [Cloacibacterium normanense]|uniref:Pyridine nucleotide-disulfide oxidoreductase family protein n=1 Tax=Cloacibacterium normanense TaxID=237258 RepID=A0A1E5UGY8_9FLAO|nr:FAD-dependent oxidoreductase [Cloacibacterium normanense]AZI69701.1 CoA-disulfide reductase [Cloacibacterium normanense]OEL12162.1 pyridine nucleotide-disulfide oxidoreductase family protein [Cloacibacterium normanense]SDO53960.1 NADPH-dependent 2,4-dienoyl-CoA reductase, sulfur reductase [Cloacibacterium normanense]